MATKGNKILVIDDEKSIRTIVRLVLKRAGYDVETAEDGAEGVKTFSEGKFDLVITDIIMPEKDGINTIICLKEIAPEMPIIAISGGGRKGSMDFLEAAKKIGATKTIEKPFEPEKLLKTVRECLQKA